MIFVWLLIDCDDSKNIQYCNSRNRDIRRRQNSMANVNLFENA